MKNYYLSLMLTYAFKDNPYAKLVKLYQTSSGWLGVIKDSFDGQEYTMIISPTREKVVAPETADQLLKMNGE